MKDLWLTVARWVAEGGTLGVIALMLFCATYLVVGIVLVGSVLKGLKDFDLADYNFQETVVVVAFLTLAFGIGSVCWPIIWGLYWLWRGCKVLLSGLRRTM